MCDRESVGCKQEDYSFYREGACRVTCKAVGK